MEELANHDNAACDAAIMPFRFRRPRDDCL